MANLREEITAELIEQMERGTASWVKPWTAQAIYELPFNANTGNRYQGINSMVLSGAGFEDPRWLTFNQAKAVEAHIRKGSRGKKIIFWSDRTEKTILDQNGKPIRNEKGEIQKEAVRLTNPVVRAFTVFNGSQIEGLEPYKAPEIPNTIEQIDEVEKLLRSTAVPLYHDQRDRAFYGVSPDEIHMPRPEAFNSQYEYYATALHEMGHASGHQSRLWRDMGGAFGSQKYAYEELRAEMASFMSTTQLGLGHYPERHAGYVQNWLSAAKEDKDFLFQAAADAEKISKWVIEPEQRLELEEKAQKKRVPQFLSPTEKARRLEREKEKEVTAQKALKPAELTEEEISKLDLSVVLQDSGREALGTRKTTNFWVHEPARSLSHVYIQTRAPLTQNADSLNKVLLDADKILSGDLSDERIKELPHLNLTLPQITYNRKTGMHEVRFEAQTVTEKESLFWTENKSRTDLIEVVFKSHDQKKAQHLAQGFVNATRALEAQKIRVNQPKPMIWLDVTMDNIVEARAKGVLFSPKEQRFYAPDTMAPKDYEKWLPKKEQKMEQEQTQSPSERVYLNVPKEERAEVKKFGGRWDQDRQLWHVPADQLEAAQAAGNWSLADEQGQEQTQQPPQERVYLNVPKDERAEVKKFGGRWDQDRQLWHVPADQLEVAQAAGNWSLAGEQAPAQTQQQEQAQAVSQEQVQA